MFSSMTSRLAPVFLRGKTVTDDLIALDVSFIVLALYPIPVQQLRVRSVDGDVGASDSRVTSISLLELQSW